MKNLKITLEGDASIVNDDPGLTKWVRTHGGPFGSQNDHEHVSKINHRLTFKDYEPLPTEIITGMTANYSMTHLINMMGENIIYLETGVNKGSSISAILRLKYF